MRPYPRLPPLEGTDAAGRGHLWLREFVVGGGLRARLTARGLVVGDRERTYDPGEEPLPLGAAARHLREHLDRGALRAAVDEPEAVVLFGVVPRREAIAYDWERTPPFLGTEIWDGSRVDYLPVDAAERAFDRLGLTPVNAVEREVNARDFHPDRYEFPVSEWYPGPAAGVVVRNRSGGRGLLSHPAFDPEDRPPAIEDADRAVEELLTDRRLDAVVDALVDAGRPVTVDAVLERTLERIAREEYARLYRDGPTVDEGSLREAAAERVGRWLDERA